MDHDALIARLESLVLVAIGGFAGSNLRYLFELLGPTPGATVLVNALGSFALGVVLYEALRLAVVADRTRLVVATGFLSSFTTYSTFALQTAQAATPPLVVGNVVASYALGFGGVVAGRRVVEALRGRGA